MSQYLDIIILLVVVVLIFQKLKTLLGTRPDMEERQQAEIKAAKILTVVAQELEKQPQKDEETAPTITSESTAELSDTDKTLKEIPNFNKESFLTSAKKAFELIVTSFAKGDTQTLEMLVNNKLYKKLGCVVINVATLSIEETASMILNELNLEDHSYFITDSDSQGNQYM